MKYTGNVEMLTQILHSKPTETALRILTLLIHQKLIVKHSYKFYSAFLIHSQYMENVNEALKALFSWFMTRISIRTTFLFCTAGCTDLYLFFKTMIDLYGVTFQFPHLQQYSTKMSFQFRHQEFISETIIQRSKIISDTYKMFMECIL